jgi:hypothetical protein
VNPKLAKIMAATKGRLTTAAQMKRPDAQEPAAEEFPDDDDFIEDSLGRIRRRAKKEGPEAPVILTSDPWRPGDRVIHSTFGKGVVIGCRGAEDRRSIQIDFAPPVGLKELQLAFAGPKLSSG